jgi:hypothetical protein
MTHWLYENAIKALLTIAVAAWGIAFAAWSRSVDDARDSYIEGQAALTAAINQQQSLRELLLVVRERQDRVILVLDDLEKRVRLLEVRAHE